MSRFLGRDDDVVALAGAVARSRLVTVTGPGGVGKTRLVAEARKVIERAFDAPASFASLAGLDAGADVSTVSALFGAPSPGEVAMALGEGSSLVVLDNCEHLVATAARFVAALLRASDRVSVIATSREPLYVSGERLIVVEPLALPGPADDASSSPAVQLFFDRALEAGACLSACPEVVADVVELCRRIDGLPLAIELAASRARSLSPHELLTLTNARLDVLTASRHDDARHHSVRAAIEVSVDRLDAETRGFFQRLAVFAGPFDIDLAHAVASAPGTPRIVTIERLGQLVNRSLVVSEVSAAVTRFHLLELVREFAAGELDASGDGFAANEQLTDLMVAEADHIVAAGHRQWTDEILGRIVARVNHLTTAIHWCVDHDAAPDRAYRLLVPLFGAVHQHLSPDVHDAAERLFTRWPDTSAPFRGEAMGVWATACAVAGEFDAVVPIVNALFDDPMVTVIGRAIGARACVLAALSTGDLPGARHWVAVGRAVAGSGNFGPLDRELASFEASILDRLGDARAATDLAQAAIDTAIAADGALNEMWARVVAANIAARAGHWADVAAHVSAALLLNERNPAAGRSVGVFRSRATLAAYDAAAHAVLHGWASATGRWQAAVEAAAQRGSLVDIAITLRAAAGAAREMGHGDVAERLAGAIPECSEIVVLPDVFAVDDLVGRVVDRVPTTPAALLGAARDALAMRPDGDRDTRTSTTLDAASIVCAGDMWELTFRGTSAWIRDLKGLQDLTNLLGRPGEAIHCLELVGESLPDACDRDASTVQKWRSQISELAADIDDARAANDLGRAERAEAELDALVSRLSDAFGVAPSQQAGTIERSRNTVSFRIRTAQRRIAEVHPELGRHLRNSVRTGAWCVYEPEVAVTWNVRAA